jgi:hypothetical protein
VEGAGARPGAALLGSLIAAKRAPPGLFSPTALVLSLQLFGPTREYPLAKGCQLAPSPRREIPGNGVSKPSLISTLKQKGLRYAGRNLDGDVVQAELQGLKGIHAEYIPQVGRIETMYLDGAAPVPAASQFSRYADSHDHRVTGLPVALQAPDSDYLS